MSLSDPTGGANSGAPAGARLPQTITLNAGQPGQIRAAVATGGQVVTMSQQAATASGNGGATNRCDLRNFNFFSSYLFHCIVMQVLYSTFSQKLNCEKTSIFAQSELAQNSKLRQLLFNEQIGKILISAARQEVIVIVRLL